MKLLRFLFLIFRKGSLQHASFDFEAERREIVNQLPSRKQSEAPDNFKIIKTQLKKSKIGYSLLANMSYLLHARQMNVMLFVSSTKKLVFVRILKSASTSILKELLPTIDQNLKGHSISDEQVDALAFYYVKKEIRSEEQHYTQFALVRNPFHRIVSVYLDLFDPKSNHFSYESYWFGILQSKMTFSEFVDTIAKVPDFLKGPHFAPQHFILSNIRKPNNIQHFRIDKDQEILTNFLTTHGINLPHQNKQVFAYNYMTFYTTDLVNKVYALYRQDVMAFDYSEEHDQLINFVSNQENRMM